MKQQSTKYAYNILAKIFKQNNSIELRDECLENGVFSQFIETIGKLTCEPARELVEESPDSAEESEHEEEQTADTKKKNKDDNKKEKKGVGYTTGDGEKWDVSEYLENK